MTTPAAFTTSASLYVGDLANDVTEGNLFEIFNAIGPVASIRVCRDAITRRSLGYAYVNFHTHADAERALDAMNNEPIKGRPCRIMWSQRDPSLRKSGKGNVFIKNLDKTIDHKALFETFGSFGEVLSVKVELDEHNQSKGYGYIQFAKHDDADKAINKMNGMIMNGKKVFVGPFVPKKERSTGSEKVFTNVYVKELDERVDEDKLRVAFSKFGVITNAVIMREDGGKSKGFGFVNFAKPEEAQRAVSEMNGREVEGKVIYVGRAQKKAERESELRSKFEQMKLEQYSKYQGVNLYVKNLDDDFEDERLLNEFKTFGTITSAKVMRDAKGVSRGFGFVCYSTPEEATRAITELNGKIVGTKPLYVSLAQRKDVRRTQLEAQFAQRSQKIPGMLGRGVPAPALYNGGPLFYPPGQGGFVYPGMMARGRFPPTPYQPIPNWNMVVPGGGAAGGPGGPSGGGRGGPQMKNGGRGSIPRGGRGMKAVQTGSIAVPIVPPQPQPQQPIQPVVDPAQPPLTPTGLAAYSPEEQKRLLGDRLYALIAKINPTLAGKVTGMILESTTYMDELFHLIEDPQALNEKVEEAMKVLREHDKGK